MMAKFGIFGLIAILGLYLMPATIFLRHSSSPDKIIRSCAGIGMALSVGLMVLGLTDVVFTYWEIPPFYVLTVAFLLTYIEKREKYVETME
jgi:O-antigen ligase